MRVLNALKATIKAIPLTCLNFVLVIGTMIWGTKMQIEHYVTNQPITVTKIVIVVALAVLITVIDIISKLRGE